MKTLLLIMLICISAKLFAQVRDFDALPDDSISYEKFFSQGRDSTLLLIKLNKLSTLESFYVYNAINQISYDNNAHKEINIKKNASLFSLIGTNYKLSENTDNKLYRALADSIQKHNYLDVNKTIYEGELLLLPNIPVKPAPKSSEKYSQYFDFYANTSAIVKTADLFSETFTAPMPVESQQAATFSTHLKNTDLNNFKLHIPIDILNKNFGASIFFSYKPGLIEVKYPEGYDSSFKMTDPIEIPGKVLAKIMQIDTSEFKQFIILDSFVNKDCTHGQKVRQVVETRLTQYGLSAIANKIVSVPINYFQNKDYALDFLKKYYEGCDGNVRTDGLDKLRQLSRLKKKSDLKYGFPDFYLSALFAYWYNQRPDIISSSFYVSRQDNQNALIPRIAKNNVTLITAALNDGSTLEDKLYIGERPSNGSVSAPEPLWSYYMNNPKAATVISGCYLSPGKYSGMKGEGISLLGRGIGWGDESTCLKPGEYGTSFGTPDIATSLYIAKAYWRTKKIPISSDIAKKRLLLAVELDTGMTRLFDAGGMVNMEKLLQEENGFYDDTENGVRSLKMKRGFVTLKSSAKLEFGSDEENISGISYVSGRFYAFQNSKWRWKEIEPAAIDIEYYDEATNAIQLFSIEDFKHRIKEIVKF